MTEIVPALTPEEWTEARKVLEGGTSLDVTAWLSFGPDANLTRRQQHATASLCLYGQPYGFTQEDVELVLYGDDGPEDMAARRILAAKLAALLPPP
jgi:hypothetical protein